MSEISLSEYLAKLNNLLEQQATDQVILHSRHILQTYPRNVTVYRVLGRAMVAGSRWQEAEEIFRRVLSVYPDDYAAHRGMSEIYQHAQRYDDAIWHLERAFEQDPNNESVIGTLRKLYRDHRNVDQPKVQLTSGAVARQYAASALYDQAVDTLQRALEREPDRIDLRLLMAETLWNSGYHIEAAETAMEVLRVLPDCFEANRIMTRLWLGENRPSDAQRFLSRIENVDPYAALELATGQHPDDSALILEELDYERVARQEMASSRPSWLTEIGEERAPQVNEEDWLGGVSYADSGQSSPSALTTNKSFNMDVPEDWLAEAMDADAPASAAVPSDSMFNTDDMPDIDVLNTGELLGMEFPTDIQQPNAADELPALDDLFGTEYAASELGSGDVVSENASVGLEDWLAGLDAGGQGAPDATIAFPPDDLNAEMDADKEPTKVMRRRSMLSNLAEQAEQAAAPEPNLADMWATDSGSTAGYGFTDALAGQEEEAAAPEPDLADIWATDAAPSNFDSDSMGGYGFTGALQSAEWQPDAPMFDDMPAASTSGSTPAEVEDPLAWLRGSEVELSDEAGARLSDYVDDSEMNLQAMDAPSPTAWLANYGGDMLVEDAETPDEEAVPEEADPLAWLRGEVEILDDDEVSSADEFEVSLPLTPPPPPPAAPSAQPVTDWSTLSDESFLDEALNMESLSVSGDFAPDVAAAENTEDVLDWDAAISSVVDNDSPPDMDFADALMGSEYDTMTNGDDALLPHDEESWGRTDETPEELAAAGLSDITDWQGDMSDERTGSDNDQPNPDWLQPDSKEPESETSFEWLEEEQFPTTELSPPENKSGMLQWLSGGVPTEGAAGGLDASTASDEPAPAPAEASFASSASFGDAADDSGFEWLAGDDSTAAPAAASSWTSELDSNDDNSETDDDDFASLFGTDTGPERQAEVSAAEEWLPNADLPPAPDSSEYGFTGMLEATSWDQDADESPEDTGEADWLAQLRGESAALDAAPDDDELSQPISSGFEGDFASDFGLTDTVALSDDELNFMNTAAAEDDVEEAAPDWLSELRAESDPTAASMEPAAADAVGDEFDFMAAPQTPAASEFDFISALNDDDEMDITAEPASVVPADESADWLSELRIDSGVADSDVLDADEAQTEISFDTNFSGADDEFGYASGDTPAPAGDMPDWLSELQSDAEADEDMDEDSLPEPVASDFGRFGDDFDDNEEEEFGMMADAVAAPADDVPDWLSELQSDAEADEDMDEDSLPEPVTSEFGDFGSDFDDDEEDEFGLAAMSDTDMSASAASDFRFDEADEDATEFDFEDDAEAEAFEAAPATGDMPDWLSSMGSLTDSDAEEEAETEGALDWMAAGADDGDIDDDAYFAAEFAEGEELEEHVLAQGDAPPPAKNAPDWLNAMVPGLDLDFDAPEDEPIEQDYVEEDLTHRVRASRTQTAEVEAADTQDFNWLTNIVEEESRAAPEQAPAERRRFTFSRPPLWLRSADQGGGTSSGSNGGAAAAGIGAGAAAAALASAADEDLTDFDFNDEANVLDDIDDWVKDDSAFDSDSDSDSDLDLDSEFGLDDDLDMLEDFGSDASFDDEDDEDDDFAFGSDSDFDPDDDEDDDLDAGNDFDLPDYLR